MASKLKMLFIYLLLFLLGIALVKHFIDFPIVSIFVIGLLVIIAYKIKIPKFPIFLFCIAFFIRIITVLFIDSPIISDYAAMYNLACEFLHGNWNAAHDSIYMTRWGYQVGYSFVMYLIMLIFKGPLLIKLVNCIFTSFIVVLIYLIAKELTNEKAAKIVSICYLFFPFPLLFNTVLSNQHISSFMFLLAIYILISKKTENMNDKLKFCLIGLCLAVGNIIRPEAIVIIVSIILYLILLYKKGTLKQTSINAGLMLIVYFAVTISASLTFQYSGISQSGLRNTEPLYKFAVGFNQAKLGDYNKQLGNDYFSLDNGEKRKLVYDSTIGSIGKLPMLFEYKIQHFWLDSDLSWSLFYLDGKKINIFGYQFSANSFVQLCYSINQLFLYLFFILALASIFIHQKKMTKEQFLLVIILLVYSGVYLLIECTPRYAYIAQIFLFLMAAYSIEYFIKFYSNRRSVKLLKQ